MAQINPPEKDIFQQLGYDNHKHVAAYMDAFVNDAKQIEEAVRILNNFDPEGFMVFISHLRAIIKTQHQEISELKERLSALEAGIDG